MAAEIFGPGAYGESPLLTPAEELQLARRVQRGDPIARARMIEANIRLVYAIASNYLVPSLPIADLVQEGMIGLIVAVDKYDWRRKTRFSTHAVWWIRKAVSTAIQQKARPIRLPETVTEVERRVKRASEDIKRQRGTDATERELARAGRVSIARLREVLSATQASVASLDAPLGEDDRPLRQYVSGPATAVEDAVEKRVVELEVRSAIALLPMEMRQILHLKYGIGSQAPVPVREIAEVCGLPPWRVRAITREALAILATMREIQSLRSAV